MDEMIITGTLNDQGLKKSKAACTIKKKELKIHLNTLVFGSKNNATVKVSLANSAADDKHVVLIRHLNLDSDGKRKIKELTSEKIYLRIKKTKLAQSSKTNDHQIGAPQPMTSYQQWAATR